MEPLIDVGAAGAHRSRRHAGLWPARARTIYFDRAMKIQVADITEAAKELSYGEDVGELNARLERGVRDYRVTEPIQVDLSHYRTGEDLIFAGAMRAAIQGVCARCLEEYGFTIDRGFRFVLSPRSTLGVDERELSADDLAFSFYEGKEIDLMPFVHEQAILALPTRPLCAEDCRGLCARCGANLNAGACGCPATEIPRLGAALAGARAASRRREKL
jgi:uncharacterized protein